MVMSVLYEFCEVLKCISNAGREKIREHASTARRKKFVMEEKFQPIKIYILCQIGDRKTGSEEIIFSVNDIHYH